MLEGLFQFIGVITSWILLSLLAIYLCRKYVYSDDHIMIGVDMFLMFMIMPATLIMGLLGLLVDIISSPFIRINKLEKKVKKLEKKVRTIKKGSRGE